MSKPIGAIVVTLLACRAAMQSPPEPRPPEQPPNHADLILHSGNVVTLDARTPTAESIAIAQDRIVAIGTNEEIAAWKGKGTTTIDLRGKLAVPGLIDAHMHFSRLGTRLRELFLDAATSPAEVVRIVEEQVAKSKPGEWITGRGWHTVFWDEKEYPQDDSLSRISPNNPVYLAGMANHAAWVNDKALELAGITKKTPNPADGRIVRHPKTGRPTGVLLEGAKSLAWQKVPPMSRERKKADIEASVKTALTMGLTTVHDAGAGYDEIEIYKELLAEGKLELRLYVMFYVEAPNEDLDKFLRNPPEIGEYLTIRSIKAYADGALGARGAALLEPYADRPKETGMVSNDADALRLLLSKAQKAGYQVGVHAIGDRGNRSVLDAVERVQSELGAKDMRARIEHTQVLSLDDIPRLAELGVIASMQPVHAPMDMGFAEARLGPKRVAGAYAWKSLLDSGARIAAGADVPAFPVSYSNPLLGFYSAVTRQDATGNPAGGWQPQQRVTRRQALEMYTIHAAYAGFQEEDKGTLTPGKLADITVISRNILEIPAAEILETDVTMTIVGGKVVYQSGLLPP